MNITYENGWEYMDIHVDVPVPFEDNYQMRMLRSNEIPGLAEIKGSGRDGSSRYTYRIRSGISIDRKYGAGEMKKADVEKLTEALVRTAEALAGYMLSPDGLILTPDMIFTHGGKYEFCYLPVSAEGCRVPLCRSFHKLTEYFTGRLDYHDTEGIFLVYKLHKETMKDSYELRKILEESRQEEKEYHREMLCRERKNYRKKEPEQEQEQETEKEPDPPPVPEKKGLIRRTVSRFRTGRWGEWKELITEMDDGNR